MNGVHDLGGMQGFGPVQPEANEPVFHATWEGIVFAMIEVARQTGLFNVDEFRFGIERMAPAHYLASSYYEKWLETLATNLTEKGFVSDGEVAARMALLAGEPASVESAPPRGTASRANAAPIEPVVAAGARFQVGDRVTAKNVHPTGHTRLPRYVRGKRGGIDRVHGVFSYPDTSALGLGKHPQAVYSVCFAGQELWGDSAEAGESLYIDLWDSYLDPA